MHRSRLLLLALVAAMPACSTRDDVSGAEMLAQDSALVATLQVDRNARPVEPSLPDACAAQAVSAQPAASKRAEADELARRGYDAELRGDVREASTLLRRATGLDGTNRTAAYHLGRVNETLGDRDAAVNAYCRYLTLSPTTAEAADSRQRIAKLSRGAVQMAAGAVVSDPASAPRRASARRAPRAQRAPLQTASAEVTASATPDESENRQAAAPSSVPAAEVSTASTDSASPSDATVATGAVMDTVESAPAAEVVAATPRPQPSAPSSETRSASRGPSRAQTAIIGAATGAIIGAATGRSVKGAVIGAAAGGVLGTVVGRGIRP